jgi:hypothetical protein
MLRNSATLHLAALVFCLVACAAEQTGGEGERCNSKPTGLGSPNLPSQTSFCDDGLICFEVDGGTCHRSDWRGTVGVGGSCIDVPEACALGLSCVECPHEVSMNPWCCQTLPVPCGAPWPACPQEDSGVADSGVAESGTADDDDGGDAAD